jgi:hypothetical protein
MLVSRKIWQPCCRPQKSDHVLPKTIQDNGSYTLRVTFFTSETEWQSRKKATEAAEFLFVREAMAIIEKRMHEQSRACLSLPKQNC